MPPAPTPARRAGALRPGAPGRRRPAAARRPDSAPETPHPSPAHRAATPTTPVPPPALVPPAGGRGPARRLGCGPRGPNRAPAPPRQAGHAATSVPGMARGAGASSPVSLGPRGPWPALHTDRPPAGHRRRGAGHWTGARRAASARERAALLGRGDSAPGCGRSTSCGPACGAGSPAAAGSCPPAARACLAPPPGGWPPVACPATPP